MSQRSEKLHRQVAQLRADVDALQVAWLSQQHCDAVELAAAAERTRQAHRRASEAQRTARAWKLNAILTLILAALIAGVALVISAKAITTEPATPSAVISPLDNGRLPGDDTPAIITRQSRGIRRLPKSSVSGFNGKGLPVLLNLNGNSRNTTQGSSGKQKRPRLPVGKIRQRKTPCGSVTQ